MKSLVSFNTSRGISATSAYDDKDIYEFDKLNELKKKIILTHKEYKDIKNSFKISCYRNDEPRAKILEYKGISGKRFLEEFDYTGFLN